VLCPLDRISTVVTDSGIRAEDRKMLTAAGVKIIVAERASSAIAVSVA
jgi:DeoR family ulaG and ulaABCDEF operon transcriptional repressor